jgi:hypothetical protein
MLACAICAVFVVGVGCGEESGAADGAIVSVYVAAPLCAGAESELSANGGQAGDLRVEAVCLAPEQAGKRLDLAAVGTNARRATEDSTSVAYLQPPGQATRIANPILESAGIASVTSNSGKAGMSRLLSAIGEADPSSLRESVTSNLDGS